MKIIVYGGGAVGLGLAAALIHAGQDVSIIARQETAAALTSDGLIRSGLFGTLHLGPDRFKVYTEASPAVPAKADVILVCTKSYDTAAVARNLASSAAPSAPSPLIVLCQNGWGNTEKFGDHFPTSRLFNARVITGFTRPKLNQARITVHVDAVRIGSIHHQDPQALQPLCRALSDGGMPCEISENIIKHLWAKMLYNCALNPLGAIFRVPYGRLGESEHSRILMREIIHELFQVMGKAGYETEWRHPDDYLDIFFGKLIPLTAEHEASTLQDIKARKRTEIDALNGAVVALARAHGISVPHNKTVYHMIKFMESRYLELAEGTPDA